ncbi:CrcB family protein [Fructobacillus sp. M158]|uniref:CrcB family protein n=1 Tax=Fructobacillus parabroussonetiae TaxID=2713174 RepID=UPI00200B1EDF|nr:CrcB family protein [Fructobacillus parabroussonetiae]MCK8617510.1 CrcB family protein [Fructobacillus parabroussonetiae]
MWVKLLFIMLATGLGASLRYLMLMAWSSRNRYLTGVFAINLLGSLLLGFVTGLHLNHLLTLVLGTGLLGGFTTFSSMMTESGQYVGWRQKTIYLAGQFVGGLLAFVLGIALLSKLF